MSFSTLCNLNFPESPLMHKEYDAELTASSNIYILNTTAMHQGID